MNTTTTSRLITDLALQVFTKEELIAMPRHLRLDLVSIVSQHLEKGSTVLTPEELQSIRATVLSGTWVSGYTRPSELGQI